MRAWRSAVAAISSAVLLACGGGRTEQPAAPTPQGTPEPTPTPSPTPTPTPAPGTTACVPATCASLGKSCGALADGCGGTLFCGNCAAGQVCGGGGTANVCAAPAAACTPTTCAAAGKDCGRIPDGCGGTLECGSCQGGRSCGGGGTANVCGAPPVKGGETRWVRWIGGADAETLSRVRSDGAGNLYATGAVVGDGGRRAVVVRKHRSDGAPVWDKRIALADGTFAELPGLAVSPGGAVYLLVRTFCPSKPCGIDLGGGLLEAGLVKLDANGAFQWQKAFFTWLSDLAAGPNDEIAVGTDRAIGEETFDVFDAAGGSLWKGTLPNAHAFAFAPDGSLLVAWNDPGNAWRPMLSRLDAKGASLWSRATTEWVQAIATSGRGTPVVLEGNQLAVYESGDGAQRFRVSVPMWATDLAVRPGVHDVVEAIVVGQDAAGCNPLAARAYDLAGAFRWVRLVGPAEGCAGAPLATGATVLDDANVVVSGSASVRTDLGAGAHDPVGASDAFLLQLAP